MITQEQANACLEEVARELKGMSYEELCLLLTQLPCSPSSRWRASRQLSVAGEKLYVNVLISRLDYFRRRVSVEMVLSSEGETQWPHVPCVYFERFKSGRLSAREASRWEVMLFKALPYAFVALVAIGLAIFVLYLLLRAV